MRNSLPPLITIVGPTASGKTQWSLAISDYIDGVIISADSRQLYRYMDVGTAKVAGEWKWQWNWPRWPERVYMVQGIPHYMIDILSPDQSWSVSTFQTNAIRHAHDIVKTGCIPMLVGGTGLYIQSVVDNYNIPEVPPNNILRQMLSEQTTDELLAQLAQLDPVSATRIDTKNKRRIIRAIEVCQSLDAPLSQQRSQGTPLFEVLQIGIHVDRETLYTRINQRVDQMIADGLLDEIQWLLDHGYTWDLSSMSGVGYRQFRPYFEGDATLDECINKLKRDTRRYAKRQQTWFRRDKRINWCTSLDEAKTHIDTFFHF